MTRAKSRSFDDDRPMRALLCSLQYLRRELEAFEPSRRSAFGVEVIHLLQSQTLGFWDDEE